MLEAKANGSSGAKHAPVKLVTSSEPAAPPGGTGGISPANLAFAEELYYQYARDPGSVTPEWRRYFEQLERTTPRNGTAGAATSVVPPTSFARSVFDGPPPSAPGAIQSRISVRLLSERVQRLVEGYREFGHLFADLDPLGLMKRPAPQIDLDDYGLASEDLDLVFSSENVAGPDRKTLRDLVELLRETYCRTIGVELAHLHDIELRSWLLQRMESTRNRLALTRADRLQIFS